MAPVEHLQVVQAEQGERFERGEEPAVLVDYTQTVGVAVRRQPRIRAG